MGVRHVGATAGCGSGEAGPAARVFAHLGAGTRGSAFRAVEYVDLSAEAGDDDAYLTALAAGEGACRPTHRRRHASDDPTFEAVFGTFDRHPWAERFPDRYDPHLNSRPWLEPEPWPAHAVGPRTLTRGTPTGEPTQTTTTGGTP